MFPFPEHSAHDELTTHRIQTFDETLRHLHNVQQTYLSSRYGFNDLAQRQQ